MFSKEKNYLDAKLAVEAILHGKEEEVLRVLYKHLLRDFIRFADHKLNVKDPAFANEILIQVLTTFWEQVVNHSFPVLENASLKTYLFSIGTHKVFRAKAKSAKYDILLKAEPIENHLNHTAVDIDLPWDDQLEFRDVLKKALTQLTPKCSEILQHSLIYKRTKEEIKDKMDYEDFNAVASSHSRCLSSLKVILKKMLNKEQLGEILNKLRL